MLFVFSVVISLIVFFQYKREKNMVNCVSLLMVPYIVIVLFNALIFEDLGFNKINDDVYIMLLSTFIVFYIGSMIATPYAIPKIYESDNELRYEQYHISTMANFVIFLGLIGIIKLGVFIVSGAFSSDFDAMEGIMTDGIVGHFLLLSYSLLPIIFLYWLDHKKKIKYLGAVILIMIVTFSSFIKYNIIGVVISLFIFTSIYKKSLLNKSIIVMVSFVLVVFVANYLIGFLIRETTVDNSFYLNHFWVYAGGSVLYDNNIFDGMVFNEHGVLYRMAIFLSGLPNMFINKINDGVVYFEHTKKAFLPIGSDYGMKSNVVDAVGYLYPYNHDFLEFIIYYVVVFLLGIILTRLYTYSKSGRKYFNVVGCNLLTYFVFFSFFGTFYINSGPWEILVYSMTIPHLFLKENRWLEGKFKIPRH